MLRCLLIIMLALNEQKGGGPFVGLIIVIYRGNKTWYKQIFLNLKCNDYFSLDETLMVHMALQHFPFLKTSHIKCHLVLTLESTNRSCCNGHPFLFLMNEFLDFDICCICMQIFWCYSSIFEWDKWIWQLYSLEFFGLMFHLPRICH